MSFATYGDLVCAFGSLGDDIANAARSWGLHLEKVGENHSSLLDAVTTTYDNHKSDLLTRIRIAESYRASLASRYTALTKFAPGYFSDRGEGTPVVEMIRRKAGREKGPETYQTLVSRGEKGMLEQLSGIADCLKAREEWTTGMFEKVMEMYMGRVRELKKDDIVEVA